VYELSVERTFAAAHAIVINGRREPIHGHNWTVRAVVRGDDLDDNDLLVDFHRIERDLDAILAPFHNGFLNEIAPFDRINPTAERVAQFIAESLAQRVPKSAALSRLEVTEAPGCTAAWIP
jgi:6-pyruvoyltetrahydropterin/6-carboxytetrahydropterin synthase